MQRSKKRKAKISQFVVVRAPLASAVLLALSPAYAQQGAGLETVIVTAQKRAESLQDVPISIQALGAERLEELGIQSFGDYMKYLPSVSYTTTGQGFSLAYFRGVASGENNNHSGPQPTVGMYLDEQPLTTIQGAVDLHLYDIARVEALAGPQGTLYGASSEAGTIRIITNKPDPSGFVAGYGVEINSVSSGGRGYVVEGFANIPIGANAAIRLVGWYKDDPGYIENAPGTRTYPTSGGCISNESPAPPGCTTAFNRAQDEYNYAETYGARAALGINLNDNWTVTPSVMAQKQTTNGNVAYDPKVGDLKIIRYYPENSEDEFLQAALTVEGKIGNFDLVYAGAYLKRDDVVNADYADYSYFYDVLYGSAAYWTDDLGVPLQDPSQYIHGTDGYKRQSHELRLSSPQDKRVRLVAGLFYQDQEHDIFQPYLINGLTSYYEVTDQIDTIWLTDQHRTDTDSALFGEVSFDITDQLTLTGGVRRYETESTLKGFFGFGGNYSRNYGEAFCDDDPTDGIDDTAQWVSFNTAACTNLDDKIDDSGTISKLTIAYRVNDDALVYATYSEGFRPGGINRNNRPPNPPHYEPDFLTNYEFGWKTTSADNRLRFNGAIFFEDWAGVQFSFLPPSGSGLTIVRNAGSAEIRGIELDFAWAAAAKLMLSGGLSLIDAELTADFIPDPDEPPTAFNGDQLPVTPRIKANLTARYGFMLGQFDSYVQGAVVHNDSSWPDLERSVRTILGKQNAYTIADFSTGLARDSYSFELYISNVFDERAQLFKFAQCDEPVCGTNTYIATNLPRTIGLRFSQKFGN
jgi:outer membrane receptor protein involved in Fe transport